MRKKAPKKPKKKVQSKLPIKRFLAVIIIAGALVSAFLYKQADALVVRSLSGLDLNKVSAVYSEPFMVFQGTKIPEAALRRQLQKRQYVEGPDGALNPGDYSFEQNVFRIVTREFLLPNGTTKPSSKITYNSTTGELLNSSEPDKKELILEPLMIAPLGSGDLRVSNYKRLSDMPAFLPKAFLAIEDTRFYSHMGIDPIGIVRAMIQNILARRWVQGASTITQQLAKNLLFTSQKTLLRKVREAFAALSLERHLSKDKILELYLNEVYFGRDGPVAIHGVAEAASSFLGKKVEDITISEAALLAGMVKAPSALAIRKHLGKAVERRDLVLQAMHDSSVISDAELVQAKAYKIDASEDSVHKRLAPHFITTLEAELNQRFDVEAAIGSGVAIFTGMDREMQECGQRAVTEGLAKLEKAHPALKRKNVPLEAALVAIEPYSGLVKTWVGGRDYGKNQFNHVSQAKRQIGSTIKPFLYLTALSPELNSYKVATPISILVDEPIEISVPGGEWRPENYDKKFRGDVTLRYALENSLNVPAVYVSQRVGVQTVAGTLGRFRIAENILAVPSLALGAVDTTLLQLTAAYGALANNGIYVAPRLYSSVLSANGEISISEQIREDKVAEEAPVYVLTNILQGVIERGTAKGVRTGGYTGVVAGKTGTTNDARDAWFVGFTPNLTTGVWVGYDDNKKIGLTGGVAAVPIWTEFMKCATQYIDSVPFLPPPNVITRDVDADRYAIVNPECPSRATFKEVFIAGTEPPSTCDSPEREVHLQDPVGEDEFGGKPPEDDGLFDNRGRKPSLAEELEMENRGKKTFWDSLWSN